MNHFDHHSCWGSTSVQLGWFSFLTSDSLIEGSSLITSTCSPNELTGTICNHSCVLPPTTWLVSFFHLWYKWNHFHDYSFHKIVRLQQFQHCHNISRSQNFYKDIHQAGNTLIDWEITWLPWIAKVTITQSCYGPMPQ